MPGLSEKTLALIGRYIVSCTIVAAVLMLRIQVPLWCAFPLTAIWMIAAGSLGDDRSERRSR